MKGARVVGDFDDVSRLAARLLRGDEHVIDLTGVTQTRHAHEGWDRLPLLAWWLLGAPIDDDVRVHLPEAAAARRHLIRTGILPVCRRRKLRRVEEALRLGEGLPSEPARLPNVDWEIVDHLFGGDDQVRIVPDLEHPRRAPQEPEEGGRYYLWLASLDFGSVLTGKALERFVADADRVLYELIENVHKWAESRAAMVVVSVTSGGGSSDGGKTPSFNRLHIVVADTGIGIIPALRRDRVAWDAVAGRFKWDQKPEKVLKRLVEQAFGDREIPNHNGQGLNFSKVSSDQWLGAMHIFTADPDDHPDTVFMVQSSGDNRPATAGTFHLPRARGTLVHVQLDARLRHAETPGPEDPRQLEIESSPQTV